MWDHSSKSEVVDEKVKMRTRHTFMKGIQNLLQGWSTYSFELLARMGWERVKQLRVRGAAKW